MKLPVLLAHGRAQKHLGFALSAGATRSTNTWSSLHAFPRKRASRHRRKSEAYGGAAPDGAAIYDLNPRSAASSSQFFYVADHQRYQQFARYSGAVENTIYVGGLLEKMSNSTGTAYRHYIPAGTSTVIYTRLSTGTNSTYYLTKDHIGSTAVVTDSTGASFVSEKFSALGWNENTASQEATMATISRHEFTGHEGLDNAGIWMVNMNGRIYSPSGSWFMSPDPYISDPGNTQNYNRYGYVYNNPLTNTDPTGFFSLGNLLNPFSKSNPLNPFGSFGRKLALAPFTTLYGSYRFATRTSDELLRDERWLQPIAEIAACYYGGPWACAAADAKLTRLNGGTMDQALIAGVTTFVGGQFSTGIDNYLNVPSWGGGYQINAIADAAIAHGAIEGVSSSLTGGTFWRGFEVGAGGSLLTSGYEYFALHAPGWGAGQDRPDGGMCCRRIAAGGDCFYQSGACSNFLDHVPGLQAVSQLHDNWMINLPSGFNFPSMPFAAALSYGSLIGGSYYVAPYLNVRH
ncbi:MAG: RHS repeat-associated core domain-containing protein [Steroidobacteraceae bacterium]